MDNISAVPPHPDGERLRFLIFGAGAVGTYIGGSLALAGYPVVFLERPEVAAELRRKGLFLGLSQGRTRLPSPSTACSIEEALAQGPFEAAIFALKSYDTLAALESLMPHEASLPPFLCLQNGVDNEAALEAALGPGKVIAGSLTSAIQRNAAGDISLQRLRGVGIAAGNPLSAPLVDALNSAGLNARLFPRAADMKWSKMLTNLLANASSAILDMTPGEIFKHSGLCYLEIAQLREALAVMRSQQIRAVDLPATPVRLLALSVLFAPGWLARPLLQRAVGAGRGGKMPSFHIDLHSGSGKSEVDYL
ncbi:MAG: 2-dehydropantoate 2-reductase, partial [Anaerolineales bacterium]|nr:2-dehydropantoate 2-reductase [Anaerolineales bacterium]